MSNQVSTRSQLGLIGSLAFVVGACGSGSETGDAGPGNDLGFGNNDPVALEEVTLEFKVSNTSSTERHETISASIPFPERAVTNLAQLGIDGYETAWLPLQRWADGSFRVAQVQFTDTVPANTEVTYVVEQGRPATDAAFRAHPSVAGAWPGVHLGARVRDTNGHLYEAAISGSGETLQSSALKRTRRWRVYHESASGGGIGRDFLASTFYVTDFRDTPFVIVDWIFGNDYLGADNPGSSSDPNLYPLGPVDINDVALMTRGFGEIVAYRPDWHDVRPGVVEGDGRLAHVVMDNDWIADGQTRRYRFLARFDSGVWRDRFQGFADGPMHTLAALRAWQQCRALGLLGGPVDPPSDAAYRANQDFMRWAGRDYFGTWGSFGDTKYSHATGTPRNGPLSEELAHAAQSGDLRLLTILEQKCWAQAQRPYHQFGLTVASEPDVQLVDGIPLALHNRWSRDLADESFGRRALRTNDPWASYRSRMETGGTPHGWNAYDRSHWTTDLLFDHWTVSGDAWAQEGMRQLGQNLRGIHHYHGLGTNVVGQIRAEGWAMQSFVQCYLATGDEGVKQKAIRRTHEIIDAQRLKDHPSRALRGHGPDSSVNWPASDYKWYSPWQNYSVFLGYVGAYRFFDDPIFLTIAEDCVSSISHAWIENYTNPTTGDFTESGYRYACVLEVDGQPVPPNYFDSQVAFHVVRGSQSRTIVTGLLHVAMWTRDAAVASEAYRMARILLPELGDHYRWDKWSYVVPQSMYD